MERYLKNVLGSSKFVGVEGKRSETMAAIRSKGNRTTELALRMAMVRAAISGWTMHPANVPGRPDFFFRKQRVAVFVDGCFWHGCLRCGHTPKTRSKFWTAKFRRNKERDLATVAILKENGIRTLRIWEHSLKSSAGMTFAAMKVACLLKDQNRRPSRKRS